jgi:4-hydroxybenzoate polyprenyltransferase
MPSQSIKISAFIKVIRYPNLLIMAATQLLSAAWLTPDDAIVWENISLWFALLATLCIAAGGYIINDIFDFEADTVNKPDKVIISSQNKSNFGLAYYGISVLGILFGLASSLYVGLICFVMVALLYFYSYKLKKTVLLGNIAVAVMSATVLLILLFIFPEIETVAIWVYAAFAFFTTLVREITKDIEDVEGDKQANYPTLPVVKGTSFAKKIAVVQAILLLMCMLVFAIWCLLNLRLLAFYYLVIFTIIPTVGLVLLLYWAKEKKHYSQASLLSKLIMLLGIISMYFIL